jgi:serine/threonine-protein kinase
VVARRRAVTALCIVTSVLVSGLAHADEKTANAAAAQRLFDEALKLMDSGSYAEACPKLARSQELAPSGGTLLNLGDCYEKNGQTASAWVSFRDAAARAATAGQKPAQAAALVRADALAPKLLRLTMTLAPGARVPGLEIKRDGQLVSNAELGIDVPVDAGLHKIEATAPGHVTWTKNVGVVQGTPTEPIVIPALELRPAAPSGTTASTADPNLGNTQRMVGLVVAGGGLLAAGIGAVFGLKAFSTNDDALAHCRDATDAKRCDPTGLSLTDEARTQATLSTVLVSLGGVALAGGLVLYVIAPRAQPTVGGLKVVPYATASSGGLGLHTAW